MVCVQKSSYSIKQKLQNSIFAQLASVAMQYCLPSECMTQITQVVTAAAGQIVDQKLPKLCEIPNVNSNAGKASAGEDGIRSLRLLVPAISP